VTVARQPSALDWISATRADDDPSSARGTIRGDRDDLYDDGDRHAGGQQQTSATRRVVAVIACMLFCAAVGGGIGMWTARPGLYAATAVVTMDGPDPTSAGQASNLAKTARSLATKPDVLAAIFQQAGVPRSIPVTLQNRIAVSTAGVSRQVRIRMLDQDGAVASGAADALATSVVNARKAVYADLSAAVAGQTQQVAERTAQLAAQNSMVDAANATLNQPKDPAQRGADIANLQTATLQRDAVAQQLRGAETQLNKLMAQFAQGNQPVVTGSGAKASRQMHSLWRIDAGIGAVVGLIAGIALLGLINRGRRKSHGDEAVFGVEVEPWLSRKTLMSEPEQAAELWPDEEATPASGVAMAGASPLRVGAGMAGASSSRPGTRMVTGLLDAEAHTAQTRAPAPRAPAPSVSAPSASGASASRGSAPGRSASGPSVAGSSVPGPSVSGSSVAGSSVSAAMVEGRMRRVTRRAPWSRHPRPANDFRLRTSRPPLPRGRGAARLPAERLLRWAEPPHSSEAQAAQRRILDRATSNLRRAARDYRDLIESEPVDPRTPRHPVEAQVGPLVRRQVAIEGMFAGFGKTWLDRLWANLVEHGQLLLVVPTLSEPAADQLVRLGALAEEHLDTPVEIFVRETDVEGVGSTLAAHVVPLAPAQPVERPQRTRSARPALSSNPDAPALDASRLHTSWEGIRGPVGRATQQRILHLWLSDPAQAERVYQQLVQSELDEDDVEPASHVTVEAMFKPFSDDLLDRFWKDLLDHGQLRITIPSLSASARDQLLRLGALAEIQRSGPVSISVHETA
jgi:hypothetical protein